MKKLVIVGGGFAGLWAAFSAKRAIKAHSLQQQVEITLINKNPYHGMRPRYYESELDGTQVELKPYLDLIAAKLVVGEVSAIDVAKQSVGVGQQQYAYDKLILATGSELRQPGLAGYREYAFNIDSYEAAKKLKVHLEQLSKYEGSGQYTIVIVGGSFTGIEAATDFADRLNSIAGASHGKIILIDHGQVGSRFSKDMQAVFANVFNEMQIEVRNNVSVEQIEQRAIFLSTGEKLDTQTVVWTAGIQASPLTKHFNLPLDNFGRLPVDRFLRIQGIENCFAAGDVAHATTDGVHDALLSCQHAMPQGRFAGNNAIADLFGLAAQIYEQPKFVTSIDLGSWGAVYAEHWEQQVVSIKDEAKKIKQFINTDRIYPPTIEKGLQHLLDAAEPAFKEIKT